MFETTFHRRSECFFRQLECRTLCHPERFFCHPEACRRVPRVTRGDKHVLDDVNVLNEIVMTTKRVAVQNGNNGQKVETTKKQQKRAGSFPNLYYHQYSRFDYVLRQASSVLAGFAIIRQITFKVDIIPHFIFL